LGDELVYMKIIVAKVMKYPKVM